MYSRLQHQARSLWLGRFEWTNRMAMYSAYFDESGHPDDSDFMAVAGCVADVEQWVHFEREWIGLLEPLGTRVLHMVDLHRRNKPFHELTDSQAEELLLRLIGVIRRRVEKTVGQAIKLAKYKASNEKYILAEWYGYPYPLLGRGCIGHLQDWAAQHCIPFSSVPYFFENGAKHKGQLEWIAQRDRLPIPRFLQKAEGVPLQAGDLLAWCQNLYLTSKGSIPRIYDKALDGLAETSNDWSVVNMDDPDRIPIIMGIPKRDPAFRYRNQVLKHGGKRRALIHYWPKAQTEPKPIKKTLDLPDQPISLDAILKVRDEYDRKNSAT